MWLNYDEQYAVSEDGEVMNRLTGEWLMPFYDTQGYLSVSIYRKTTLVHRIVADRFCPKIDGVKCQIYHINNNKSDNRACNLRWCVKKSKD